MSPFPGGPTMAWLPWLQFAGSSGKEFAAADQRCRLPTPPREPLG